MECYVNPNIDYLNIPAMISRQKRALEVHQIRIPRPIFFSPIQDKMNSMTKALVVYPGLACFKNGTQSIRIGTLDGSKNAFFSTPFDASITTSVSI